MHVDAEPSRVRRDRHGGRTRVARARRRLGAPGGGDRVGARARPAQAEPQRLRAQRRGDRALPQVRLRRRGPPRRSSTGARTASSGTRSTWGCSLLRQNVRRADELRARVRRAAGGLRRVGAAEHRDQGGDGPAPLRAGDARRGAAAALELLLPRARHGAARAVRRAGARDRARPPRRRASTRSTSR